MASTIKKLSQGYGYKYAELSTIHEELERQKITYYQYIAYDASADADYIYTVLIYDGEEKPARRGCRVISGGDSMKSAAQAQGSALTYARRYSLLMALGWATEDDDGASVGPAPAKASNDSRLDFDSLKSWLEKIKTVDEVEAAKAKCLAKYPRMSEKQRNAVERIFADRCDQIENPDGLPGWGKTVAHGGKK